MLIILWLSAYNQVMNTSPDMPILYYVYDPMCSWCYCFTPIWQKLRERLFQELTIRYTLGGLAPDTTEPMSESMRNYVISQWRKIETISNIRFNYDFWEKNTPMRSTYPACRAMIAVRMQQPNLEAKAYEILQHWYYQEAKNPSDFIVLQALAPLLGLNEEKFNQDLCNNELLECELTIVNELAVNSFPSLVLHHKGNNTQISINYHDVWVIEQNIRKHL